VARKMKVNVMDLPGDAVSVTEEVKEVEETDEDNGMVEIEEPEPVRTKPEPKRESWVAWDL